MQQKELVWVGIALGLAEGGWWNDCWQALANGPRALFERVEGYCQHPKKQRASAQADVIDSWLKEQGIDIQAGDWDIMGKYGKSPWTKDIS